MKKRLVCNRETKDSFVQKTLADRTADRGASLGERNIKWGGQNQAKRVRGEVVTNQQEKRKRGLTTARWNTITNRMACGGGRA